MLKKFTLAVLSLALANQAVSSELIVRYRHDRGPTDERSDYFVQVLDLALDKTQPTDGPYRLEKATVAVKGGDSLVGVEEGALDVDWRITTRAREKRLLAVRIPLLRGMSGYRVLLIRAEDQSRFDNVRTVEDLRAYKAGQGKAWADVAILEANELPVAQVPTYQSLFFLLYEGRFDYFPRNISEVLGELEQHRDKGLTVERNILLYYPSAVYFFVNRDNAALADRLLRGLEIAIKDGSFIQLFEQFQVHQLILERFSRHSRRIFILDNPLLPEETPLERTELWLDSENKKP